MEIPLLLTDPKWRTEVREALAADSTGSPRSDASTRIHEAHRAQHVAPLLNKLRAFLLRGPVRAIVGQSASRLDISSIVLHPAAEAAGYPELRTRSAP